MRFYRKKKEQVPVVHTGNGSYSRDGNHRYSLDVFWENPRKRKALAIGINPSKANDEKSDNTLTRLAVFLDQYGFDQYTIINLFSHYSTHQKGIDLSSFTPLDSFETHLQQADAIIIVWGLSNDYAFEKLEYLQSLRPFADKLYCIENHLKKSPAHPARMSYRWKLVPFDLEKQIEILTKSLLKRHNK